MTDAPQTGRHFVVKEHVEGRFPSRYRLHDDSGTEVQPVNEFLDATAARGLSVRTLRTYAFALRHAWRWITAATVLLEQLTERELVSFIQLLRETARPGPRSPRSINLCLGVFRSFFHFHTGHELPEGSRAPRETRAVFSSFHSDFMGGSVARPRARPHLRVRVPRRLIVPLTREQVVDFLESLRSQRDLAVVACMLFCGLRSREVLQLGLADVDFNHDQLHVLGKGDKDRVLPLAPDAKHALESYLRHERPAGESATLFLVLKGQRRGQPMSASGLRSVFRHHRQRSAVANANPHRFRHTFAADMVNAGLSLPALMRLMGHTHIEMTLRYVNLTADDVRDEFLRAAQRRHRPPNHAPPA